VLEVAGHGLSAFVFGACNLRNRVGGVIRRFRAKFEIAGDVFGEPRSLFGRVGGDRDGMEAIGRPADFNIVFGHGFGGGLNGFGFGFGLRAAFGGLAMRSLTAFRGLQWTRPVCVGGGPRASVAMAAPPNVRCLFGIFVEDSSHNWRG